MKVYKMFCGYKVFEDGTIFSPSGRKIEGCENGRGYLITSGIFNGRKMTKALHAIVCEAFHGARPSEDYEAAHIDGNSYNNHKDNLKWMTRNENRLQMYEDGRSAKGELNANAKLSEQDVHTICERLCNKETLEFIAMSYPVGKGAIGNIKQRKRWTFISEHYDF